MQRENTDNLTSLWLLAAAPFDAYRKKSGFNIIELGFSEWPNRVWQDEGKLTGVKDILQRSATPLTFSTWHPSDWDEQAEANRLGLQVKSIQVGMSLSLQEYSAQQVDEPVIFDKVVNPEKAILWSNVFIQCFGYAIPYLIVEAIMERVSFSLIHRGQDTVGCIATFIKDNQVGIHSLGILNQYRKQGLAEKVIHQVLTDAKNKGLENAHLQSSQLGLGIYKKIGFKEIFKMCNYKI